MEGDSGSHSHTRRAFSRVMTRQRRLGLVTQVGSPLILLDPPRSSQVLLILHRRHNRHRNNRLPPVHPQLTLLAVGHREIPRQRFHVARTSWLYF